MKFYILMITLFLSIFPCFASEQLSPYKALPTELKAYIAEFIVGSASSKKELSEWLENLSNVDQEHKDIPYLIRSTIPKKLKEIRLKDRQALMLKAQRMINSMGFGDPQDILSSNNPDAPNHKGLTALTLVVSNPHFYMPNMDLSGFLPNVQLIEILLQLQANPNTSLNNKSLLMVALTSSDFLGEINLYPFKEKIVKLLVEYGAEINTASMVNGIQNVTPLDYALERALFKPEYQSIIDFLKAHKAIANHTHHHTPESLWARGASYIFGHEAARIWTDNL